MEAKIDRVREIAARESGLAVVVTTRSNGTAHGTVVKAGVLDHPVTHEPVVGFVARGYARKLDHLRAIPRATVVFRAGWDWVTVEGSVELAGPEDWLDGLVADDLPGLLRTVYAAAVGGSPDDWVDLDEAMGIERHAAVLIRPGRIYTNAETP